MGFETDMYAKDDTAMPEQAASQPMTSTTVPPEAVCAGIPVHPPAPAATAADATYVDVAAVQQHPSSAIVDNIPDSLTVEPPNPTRGHGGIGAVPQAPELGAEAVAEGYFIPPANHIEDIAAGRACAADFEDEPAVGGHGKPLEDSSPTEAPGRTEQRVAVNRAATENPFAHGIGRVSQEYVDAEGKDYGFAPNEPAPQPRIGATPLAEHLSGPSTKAQTENIQKRASEEGYKSAVPPPPPKALPKSISHNTKSAPARPDARSNDPLPDNAAVAPSSAAATAAPHHDERHDTEDAKEAKSKKRGLGKRIVSKVKHGVHKLAAPFHHHHKSHKHDAQPAAQAVAAKRPVGATESAKPFGRVDRQEHIPAAPSVERRRAATKNDPFGENNAAKKIHASG